MRNFFVLAGPITEFIEDKQVAVTEFVGKGGNLLILIHLSQLVITLAEKFDIQPSLAVICDAADEVNDSPQDFYVTDLVDHPLTANAERLAVFGTWGLRTREDGTGRIIARTSKKRGRIQTKTRFKIRENLKKPTE